MLVEPYTGLSLKVLAELELDKPITIPNLQHLKIVATKQLGFYDGQGFRLVQIPEKIFYVFYPKTS